MFSETMRKYPPVASILRKATKDYHVPNSNMTIKKNMNLIIPVYAIHHDPEYYPDPEKYDPDRFKTEVVAKRKPFSYLPFGEGPRICIGIRFAMMQMRIGLAILLTNFKLTTCTRTTSPIVFSKKSMVLVPEGGIHLKIDKL